MKVECVRRLGYSIYYKVYEAGVDFEPSDSFCEVKTLSHYRLHAGYALWRLEAGYSRNMKPAFYYIIAKSSTEAIGKFLNVAPWLSLIKSIKRLGDSEATIVLNNPAKFILW